MIELFLLGVMALVLWGVVATLFHLLGFAFKLTLGLLGGVIGLIGGAVGLLVALAVLPLLALATLPVWLPLALLVGLVWLLARGGAHSTATMR